LRQPVTKSITENRTTILLDYSELLMHFHFCDQPTSLRNTMTHPTSPFASHFPVWPLTCFWFHPARGIPCDEP
jgi:hypothetical protein